ncbi:MAG: SAM-dependent chlorinase/fluorinase [Bacteroidales bacterium]|nr:SAM-dependent chlorinase/fluorinase [Bacteroidales bacterium]
MQIVTLTSDWGISAHYIGAVKGKLFSTINNCQIVDISHQIKKFDILHGAFVVRNACLDFPKSTIHIIDVQSTESKIKDYQHVIIKYNDQFFVCTDNGMPSLIFEGLEIQKIIAITKIYQESSYYTFSAFDLFCKTAALIAYNTNIDEFGDPMEKLLKRSLPKPTVYDNLITCTVFYIDSYGNVFLNITIDEFMQMIGRKKFEIKIEGFELTKFHHSYDEVKENNPLLTVSSTQHLQLAINKGNASALLGLNEGSPINISINP